MTARKWITGALFGVATSTLHAQPPVQPPASAAAAAAQNQQPSSREQIINEMVTAGVKAATLGVIRPFQSTFGAGGEGEIIAYLMAAHSEREGYKSLLQALEARSTKQLGSTPSGSGSTSLAMKGLVPDILGLAVESGAINRDVSGTTLTFRATPAGVIKAVQGKELADMYVDYSKHTASRMASRISVAASFDTSKGSSGGTFTADDRQLTGWSARAELVNHRDPAAAGYANLWQGLLHTPVKRQYDEALASINHALVAWAPFTTWATQLRADTLSRVEMPLAADGDVAAAGARFKTLLEAEMPKLEKLSAMPPDVTKALDAYVAQLTRVQRAIDKVYDFVAEGDLVTFDWSTARSAALPDLYTATGIWETAFGAARKTDLTVNVAVNVYRATPSGAQHQFKSFDVTAQFDHPLGRLLSLPAVTLTLSGRYSHLPNDTVASAGAASPAVAAEHGHIGVFQAKLTIPVKGSGVKIPLSVTASNRTELIKEKDVRASVGFTFDLDPLIGGLFPSKP